MTGTRLVLVLRNEDRVASKFATGFSNDDSVVMILIERHCLGDCVGISCTSGMMMMVLVPYSSYWNIRTEGEVSAELQALEIKLLK